MSKLTHDDLCRMKLHDVLYGIESDRITILRVPGGWIYTSYSDGYPTTMSSCFVPYSNVNSARTDGAEEDDAVEDYVGILRDAERYRWLRAQHWDTSPLAVVVDPKNSVKLGRDCPSKDRLDEAIDREMARAKIQAEFRDEI